MLYLLCVLTLLAGIFFYGLSPRDDQLQMYDHQAEGMITSFLAQHQAAKDYLYTWLGGHYADTGNLQGAPDNFLRADGGISPTYDFERMMPRGAMSDMCKTGDLPNQRNQGVPGEGGNDSCFVSRVICTQSNGATLAGGDSCSTPGVRRYVVTYGGWNNGFNRPSWWPTQGQKMRKFESWRRAITNRTRGSISCGVLVEVEPGRWCIDNGDRVYKNEGSTVCQNQVPEGVIAAMPADYITTGNPGLHDLLFCISEFEQGVGNYVSGATYFYDGLANIGPGLYQSDQEVDWVNLQSPAQEIENVDFRGGKYAEITGPWTTTPIAINTDTDFTLTILSTEVRLAVDGDPVFEPSVNAGEYTLHATNPAAAVAAANPIFVPLYNYIADTPQKLISWTIQVKDCSDYAGRCVYLYENASKRCATECTGGVPDNCQEFQVAAMSDPLQIQGKIYGIRYYPKILTDEEIKKNFKVDQRRFGMQDTENAEDSSALSECNHLLHTQ